MHAADKLLAMATASVLAVSICATAAGAACMQNRAIYTDRDDAYTLTFRSEQPNDLKMTPAPSNEFTIAAKDKPAAGGIVKVNATGAEAASDTNDMESPETYIGYERAENFISDGGTVLDAAHAYSVGTPELNQWGLSGQWTVHGEEATLDAANGGIVFRFHARDLHLVLGPSPDGKPIRFRVTVDGKAPGKNHGVDTDQDGSGTVTGQRLYQLVRQTGPVQDRTFEISLFLHLRLRAIPEIRVRQRRMKPAPQENYGLGSSISMAGRTIPSSRSRSGRARTMTRTPTRTASRCRARTSAGRWAEIDRSACPRSTQRRKKASTSIRIPAITRWNSGSCGATSVTELISMQPLC